MYNETPLQMPPIIFQHFKTMKKAFSLFYLVGGGEMYGHEHQQSGNTQADLHHGHAGLK